MSKHTYVNITPLSHVSASLNVDDPKVDFDFGMMEVLDLLNEKGLDRKIFKENLYNVWDKKSKDFELEVKEMVLAFEQLMQKYFEAKVKECEADAQKIIEKMGS